MNFVSLGWFEASDMTLSRLHCLTARLPPVNDASFFVQESINPQNEERENKQIQLRTDHWQRTS